MIEKTLRGACVAFPVFFLLLLSVWAAKGELLAPESCSRYCKDAANYFNYRIGYTYEYAYAGALSTSVYENSSNDSTQSSTRFSANFRIFVLSPCDFELKITSVDVADGKFAEFEKALTGEPSQFSYQNGKIETFCPSVGEKLEYANVKRAILSAFQTNLESDVIYEADVVGTCETEYRILENGDVERTKDLTSCNKRTSRKSSWHSEAYDPNRARFSSPLLRSTQTCVQKFNNKIFEYVDCTETHVFRPFSNGDNGAKATLTQQVRLLRFFNTLNRMQNPYNVLRSSLNYDNLPAENPENEPIDRSSLLDYMYHIESAAEDGIEKEVPRYFAAISNMIRTASRSELYELFKTIHRSKIKKKFFFDALASSKSVDSVELIKQLYREKHVSEDSLISWTTSLGFTKNPSKEFINSLASIFVDRFYVGPSVYLAVSGLIHEYCKNSNCEGEFHEIFENMVEPIKKQCEAGERFTTPDDIILTLKSIGNTGHLYFAKYLKNCYLNDEASERIRIAAIQAHRRMSCSRGKIVRDFEGIFSNFSENSEIRINAYLAAMRCYSRSTIELVKTILNEEETNQVGSFVWSHLMNLQKTETFWKQELKKLIENDDLKSKFNTDPRKYSRNYEISGFVDEIDAGIGVEGNVIFTKESYIPKSLMLNLTVDMFGETVNLFEIGARLEGFEGLVEDVFGPSGYFPDNSIKNFLENRRHEHERVLPKINPSTEPRMELYAKMFGTEFSLRKYRDYTGIIENPRNARAMLFNILATLKDFDYLKSIKFLENEYQIPTVLGFPLELSVDGTASLALQTKSKANLKDAKDFKFNVYGKIAPSGSVKIIGNLGVDAIYTKIGLKSVTTLNSNNHIEGNVNVDKGKVVDIKIVPPVHDVDIINVESEIFLVKDNRVRSLPKISAEGGDTRDCTSAYFDTLTGYKICNTLRYVNASAVPDAPYFPFTGPFRYALVARKMDTFDSYHFVWNSEKTDGRLMFSLDLDTPRSTVDRRFSTFFLFDVHQKTLEFKIDSKMIKVTLTGDLQLDPFKINVDFKHTYHGHDMIIFHGGVNFLAVNYDIDVSLYYKGQQILELKGYLDKRPDALVSRLQAKLKRKQYFATTVLRFNETSHDIMAQVREGRNNDTILSLIGNLIREDDRISLEIDLKNYIEGIEDDLLLNLHLWKDGDSNQRKYGFFFKFLSYRFPEYNVLIDVETLKAILRYDLRGAITVFGKKWKTVQSAKLYTNSDSTDISVISSLGCAADDIDYIFKAAYNSSRDQQFGTVLIQLNSVQRFELLYNFQTVENGDKSLVALFYFPKVSYTLRGEFEHYSEEEYFVKLIGEKEESNREAFLNIIGTYVISSKRNLQNCSFEGTLNLENGLLKTPWMFKTNFQKTKDILLTDFDVKVAGHRVFTHLSWNKDSFDTRIEINEKKMFFVNVKTDREIHFAVGINVYQHLEASVNLHPKTKFELLFYWDKDKNMSRKMHFNLQNFGEGIYGMELEYPNQKIEASFTLQSTQITLNVTWGLQSSHKVFLNIGSKVYDLGGIWYGELETPFKYFEKQQFNIKYLIMQKNVNVEIKVFWKEHKINFVLTGSRSHTHVDGKVDLRTTFPEIYKLGLGVSYAESRDLDRIAKLTNLSMEYNQHKIFCANQWIKTDSNVDASFNVTSPSDTVKPISGNLKIRNNESASYMNSEIGWQGKKILCSYRVEETQSMILIETPFKGLERNKLKYSLIRAANGLEAEVEVDVLNQLNHAFLKWSNSGGNACDIDFKITSPVTGKYRLLFEHSTSYGYITENLVVNHGDDNNTIFGINIKGNVVSVWDVTLCFTTIFWNNNATLALHNSANPYVSNIEARWNNLMISSNSEFVFTRNKLNKARWLITSTVLERDFEIIYSTHEKYYFKMKIPGNFSVENILEVPNNTTNYHLINNFVFETPKYSGNLYFEHAREKDYVKLVINENELTASLQYKLSDMLIFDRIDVEVKSTWGDDIKINYAVDQNLTLNHLLLKPYFSASFNKFQVEGQTYFEMTPVKFSINSYLNGTNIPSFTVKGEGSKIDNKFDLRIESEMIEGHISLNTDRYEIYFNSNLTESKLLLKIQTDDRRPLEIYFTSNIKQWENVHLRLVKSDDDDGFQNGIFTLKKNNETTNLEYKLAYAIQDSFKINLRVNVSSSLKYFNNSQLIIRSDRGAVYLKADLNVYKTEIGYSSSYESTDETFDINLGIQLYFRIDDTIITDIQFDAKTKFFDKDDETLFALDLSGNKSKLKVELTKKNWRQLLIKFSTSIDNEQFVDANFKYTFLQNQFEMTCEGNSSFGRFNSLIQITEDVHKLKKVISQIEYEKGELKYSGKLSTKYTNIFWSDSEVVFALPEGTYKGTVKIQMGEVSNSFIVSLNSPQNSNKLECIVNVRNVKNANGVFDFYLDVFEAASNKFTFDYDLESEEKKIAFNYHPDVKPSEGVELQLKVNKNEIFANLDLPERKKMLFLNGKNIFRDKEVSLVYEIKYNRTVLKIDVFYTNKTYTQTKLEISSNISGYERVIFENRIDDNKVRIFFHSKFHRLSIIADKTALRQDKELFSIYYNAEPLIVIRSDNDQSYLIVSSKYTAYKLSVNYVHEPAIYTFSILENGENAISLMLMNTSTSKTMNFKGKIAAPALFPKHPEITFTVNANYDCSKLFQLSIAAENKSLFEIKWMSQLENGLYEAYFKFVSDAPYLKIKKIEIHPSLNMWNDLKVKVNFLGGGESDVYFAELAIPMKTLDTKFIVEYPCTTYRCKYNFYANRTYASISWFLPIRNMNNLKFVVNLNKPNYRNVSVGEICFEKDEKSLKGGWNFDTHNQIIHVYLHSEADNSDGLQEFYYDNNYVDKLLRIQLNKFRLLFNFKRDTYKLIKVFVENGMRKSLFSFDGVISDDHVNATLRNDGIITDILVNRNPDFKVEIVSIDTGERRIDQYTKSEGSLIDKFITLNHLITVPIVGKKILITTKTMNQTININAQVLTKNRKEIYNFTKTEGKVTFEGPDVRFFAKYQKDSNYLNEFWLEARGKSIIINFDSKQDRLNSTIIINNNSSLNINFRFDFVKVDNTYSINSNLPISLDKFLHSELLLTVNNGYFLKQTIDFPDSNTISLISKASFSNTSKSIEFDILSTLIDPYKSRISYENSSNVINMEMHSSFGDKYIMITGNIIPHKEFLFVFNSPFDGFTSASIEGKIDETKRKANVKFSKDLFSMYLEGYLSNQSNSLYKLNVIQTTNSSSRSLNAFLIYICDREMISINLKTPFDAMKNFSFILKTKSNNFEVNSALNMGNNKGEIDLRFSKDNFEKSFIFSGYYPEEKSNVLLEFKSKETENLKLYKVDVIHRLENLSKLSFVLVKHDEGLNITTEGIVAKRDILIDLKCRSKNNTILISAKTLDVSSELYLSYKHSYFKIDDYLIEYDLENKHLFKLIYPNIAAIIDIDFNADQNNFIRKQNSDIYLEIVFKKSLRALKLGFTETVYDLTYLSQTSANLSSFTIQLDKMFNFQYDRKRDDRLLKFAIKDYIALYFNSSKMFVEFDADIPIMNNVTVYGKMKKAKLFAETLFKIEENRKILVHFNELHDSTKMGIIFEFHDIYVKLNHEYRNSKTILHIRKNPNEISYEFSDLSKLKFSIRTPVLENGGFSLTANVNLPTNATIRVMSHTNEILINFQCYAKSDSYYLDLNAPKNQILSLVRFETIWGTEIFKSLNTIRIESSKIGNVSLTGNFDLKNDGLDIITHLRLPFLKNFEKLDGEVHIHNDLTPWFYITLPNAKTYSVKAVYVNDRDSFKFDLMFHLHEKIYGFKISYSKDNTLILTDVITPFEGYKRYGFKFERDYNYNNLTLNLNDRIYDLIAKSNFSENYQYLSLNLNTPFRSYDKYYFEIEREDGFFSCFAFYPGLKRSIGIGFNGNIDFGISFKVSFPYLLQGFEYGSFEIRVIPDENDYYNVSAASELNDNYVKFSLLMNNNSHIFSTFETNDNVIVYKLNNYQENYMVYNNNYIYNINFYNSLHVYIDFHYRKMSLTYDVFAKNFQIKIWDPEDYSNRFGCHYIEFANNGVNETSFGLYLPSKIFVVDLQNFVNSSRSNYGFKIFWNEEKLIGFEGDFQKGLDYDREKLIDFRSRVNLFVPQREFRFEKHIKLYLNRLEPINGSVVINLAWNRDLASQINLKASVNNRRLKSVLNVGFLKNPIVCDLNFTKLSELPFGFVLEIKYSNDTSQKIHLEMFYNKTNLDNVTVDERKFILTHLYSKLNHAFVSKTITSEKYANITAEIYYTNFLTNSSDILKASFEIGREEFEISAALESKKNSLFVHSKAITDNFSKGLTFKFKTNNKEPLNVNYLYVFEDDAPSFQILAGYGNDRYYQMYFGAPNKKEIKAQLTHNVFGKETIDGLAILRLNTTSLLWTKILLRSHILREFSRTVLQDYLDVKYVIHSTGKQLLDVIHDDTGSILFEQYKHLRQVASEALKNESIKISKDFEPLRKFCDKNILYCRDILDYTKFLSNTIFKTISTPISQITREFCENIQLTKDRLMEAVNIALEEIELILKEMKNIKPLKEAAKDFLNQSLDNANASLKAMKLLASKLHEDCQLSLSAAKSYLQMIFKPVSNLIQEFSLYFNHQKAYVQLIALDVISEIQSYISNMREVKEMMNVYNKIAFWISSFNAIDFLAPFWDILQITANTIEIHFKRLFENYVPYFSDLRKLLFEGFKLKIPTVKDLQHFLEKVYRKSVWFCNQFDIPNKLKRFFYVKINEHFYAVLKHMLGNTNVGLGIFDYVYEPELGVIEFSQRLPVEWEAFDKTPRFEQHPLYNHIFTTISSFTLDRLEKMIAKIQAFAYTILHTTIKPASNNIALMVGNDHFVTFNNKHFDFVGNCSYLLINNFDAGTFSVVLNSDRRTLSIITYNETVTINIFEEVPFAFNSKPLDFPLINNNFNVRRVEENLVVVNNHGLYVNCNLHYNYCVFQVSEWLFGKINGMLGTMDNEPNTDVRKPDGSSVVNVLDFGDSWRAGQCYENRQNTTEEIKIPSFINKAMNAICGHSFSTDNSTLSPCFPVLDPRPFYELCLNGIKKNSKAVCSAIAAYKKLCAIKHVTVKMPDFCINCEIINEDFEEERIFDGHNPKTLDVVFIQELECSYNISELKMNLNRALALRGFLNNRYASVIYGGQLTRPFTSTNNGTIWSGVEKTLTNLPQIIELPLSKHHWKVEEAIRYTAKLAFRPAITKIFVLLQCQVCPEIRHSHELYNLLAERNIVLHSVKPNPFENKNLFSIDSTNRQIDRNITEQKTVSNEEIIDNLKDMCCGLALSTGGTVSKTYLAKNHSGKWAEFVADTVKESTCQKCKCVQKTNGVGKTECARCMSPLVKQLLTEYETQHQHSGN